MRLCLPVALSLSFFAPFTVSAAPAPSNSLAQILEKTCSESACAEGYRVRFKELSFEAGKQQVTTSVTLLPKLGIDYPILSDSFEAQIVQSSFAGICKIRHVASMESIREGDGEGINAEFLSSLQACLTALAERAEKALGRVN